MEPIVLVFSILISYLLGSISFGRVFARILKPDASIEETEMQLPGIEEPYKLRSIGGNTVGVKLGTKAGCAVGLLDILKAFFPTLFFLLIYPEQPYFLFAALGAFIGHNWPVYYRFKGGRGISPFYGGLFAFDPLGALAIAVTSMFIGMVILKELIIAYAGGVLLVIPFFLITKYNDPLFYYYLGYAILINILFIFGMVPEIRQIVTLRRKYGKGDMRASMDAFPMGQQMNKLMKRLGLDKQKNNSPKG